MRTIEYRVALLVAVLTSAPVLLTAAAAGAEPQAIAGTVSGNVQKVGFRAMILKQAIEYNLAGSARNNPDGTVQFSLQGDRNRIDRAVMAIRNGTRRSSNVNVSTSPASVEPNLNTFTVIAWTSTSRHITNPYDLVFTLRADDQTMSKKEAKDVWYEILKETLKGEDLKKLEGDDDE
ncbi:MAG TPA: acylphosphatase [Xanthobacteraceae bacterium]|nr:acylphosphatase [Xanthobacteraceae bacterium]